MPVLKGNTTGSIIGIPYNLPSTIQSIVLTNVSGGSATVTLSIIEFGTNDKVVVVSETIAAGASFRTDVPIRVLAGFCAYLVVSASTDYYISLK